MPDGHYIAATSKDGSLHVYDAHNGYLVAFDAGKRGAAMTGVSWAPDSKKIVTGNFDHVVRAWQLVTLRNGSSQGKPASLAGVKTL